VNAYTSYSLTYFDGLACLARYRTAGKNLKRFHQSIRPGIEDSVDGAVDDITLQSHLRFGSISY
jgi:hypothetical protein